MRSRKRARFPSFEECWPVTSENSLRQEQEGTCWSNHGTGMEIVRISTALRRADELDSDVAAAIETAGSPPNSMSAAP